jgi:hypothetical protein
MSCGGILMTPIFLFTVLIKRVNATTCEKSETIGIIGMLDYL